VLALTALQVQHAQALYTPLVEKVVDVSNNETKSGQGCPQPADESALVDDENFLAGVLWSWDGHDDLYLACNGPSYRDPAGTRHTNSPGTVVKIGSLLVMPGCTFTGYKEANYIGEKYEVTGPALIPYVHFNDELFGSYEWSCRQRLPDCVPEDHWSTIGFFDNSFSEFPAQFIYSRTVGTSWSASMSESKKVSDKVDAAITISFWRIVASLGYSHTTEYDWTNPSEVAKSESVTTTVKITVAPFKKLQLDQAVGTCGGTTVHTEMLRAVSTKRGAEEEIVYWKD